MEISKGNPANKTYLALEAPEDKEAREEEPFKAVVEGAGSAAVAVLEEVEALVVVAADASAVVADKTPSGSSQVRAGAGRG